MTETYDTETMRAIIQEARRQGYDDSTIAVRLGIASDPTLRIGFDGGLYCVYPFAAEFIDEDGRTLAERGRRTIFLNRDGTVTKHGAADHAAVWQQHEAALLMETAHLIETMKGAKFSAWCAALRIVGVRQGINLPLRPGDCDPDEPGTI